jgi:Orsellinic acid/F9775 biosynthesis cluster protein D
MDRYLKYNSEFGLAICVTCQCGIPSTYIAKHFRLYHKSIWKKNKKKIEQRITEMELVATDDLEYPDMIREAIDGLEIKDGWSCGEDECPMCGISEKYIENHCRTEHGREAAQRKLWYQCRMQTLLRRPHIRYLYFYN